MLINKLKAFGAVMTLHAVAGTGGGMMALRPQAAKKNAPAAADDKPLSANKHVDPHGDPLPEGAVMRLGTLRRRAAGMQLAVTAEGKSILGARHGRFLCIWDADTGELRQRRELPESLGDFTLSPDGQWLAASAWKASPAIWDVRSLEKGRVPETEGE